MLKLIYVFQRMIISNLFISDSLTQKQNRLYYVNSFKANSYVHVSWAWLSRGS